MNIKDSIEKQIAKESGKQPEIVTLEDFRSEQTKTYIRHFDPRWDDIADDSRYWEAVLRAAHKKDPELAAGLMFIRGIGAQIKYEQFKVKNETTGQLEPKHILVIRPVVDERGLVGWQTKEEYEAFRDKHLKPYGSIIRQMLDILGNPELFKKVQELQNG
ncbi:MAG TPA: hypothetical protein VHY08_18430 [Bacillota bacterium]|nr:hypothetical protein [Bacillota bacterium]